MRVLEYSYSAPLNMSPERYSKGFRKKIRTEKAAFRNEQDVKSWPDVREFLGKTVPDFDDVYAKYDTVLSDWHKVRLEIAELPLNSDFTKKANEIRVKFMQTYENPKSKAYEPDLLIRLNPALKQITNIVSSSLR